MAGKQRGHTVCFFGFFFVGLGKGYAPAALVIFFFFFYMVALMATM